MLDPLLALGRAGNADLPAAVAINSVIFHSARFIGPAVAGVVLVAGGIALAFALNALTFCVFLIALAGIAVPPRRARKETTTPLLTAVGEGLRYAAGHAGAAPLLMLFLAVSLCTRPFTELLPAFAAEVFGAGAGGLAVLTSALGLGAVMAGIWLVGRDGTRGLTRIAVGAVPAFVLALAVFAGLSHLWFGAAVLVITGFALSIQGIACQTLLQLAVDDALRGRVLSLYGLIMRGGPALGALAMGLGAERVGLRWALAAGLVLTALAWLAIRLARPDLARHLER